MERFEVYRRKWRGIKNFIQEHEANFRFISDLFDRSEDNWKFKDIPGSSTSYLDILKMIMQDLNWNERLTASLEGGREAKRRERK